MLLQKILSYVVYTILVFQQIERKAVGILNQMFCINVLNIFLAEYLSNGASVVGLQPDSSQRTKRNRCNKVSPLLQVRDRS